MLPSMFYSSDTRIQMSLLLDDTRKVGFVVYYYTIAINFLLLTYCLHYNKGLDKRVTRLLLIIAGLDLVHLVTISKQGFGMAKIGIALGLLMGYEYYVKRYGKNG